MKILWIVPLVFPEASSILKGISSSCKTTGGWLVASANALTTQDDVQLNVVATTNDVHDYTVIIGRSITYTLFPITNNLITSPIQKQLWSRVVKDFEPDIVHIHGTENLLGLSYVNTFGNNNVVLSVQGIMGLIGEYYKQGLSNWDIFLNLTPYDILRKQSIWHLAASYKKRGRFEGKIYNQLKYVIGRTTTDKAHLRLLGPNTKYFHCDEILRHTFYNGNWDYCNCSKHSIFMSQGSYPVKGLHQVLKAIPILLKQYPDLKLRIAGPDFTQASSIREKLKYGGFAKYIRKQIVKNNLSDVIIFTGPLDAEEMKKEYLRANLFLSASSIENSPNSLGEAQLLGVPCLASYVGGVPDMIPNEKCGIMYRFEDLESLIYKISSIFDNSKVFDNSEMKRIAAERHSIERHIRQTINIYSQIIKDNSNAKTLIDSSRIRKNGGSIWSDTKSFLGNNR